VPVCPSVYVCICMYVCVSSASVSVSVFVCLCLCASMIGCVYHGLWAVCVCLCLFVRVSVGTYTYAELRVARREGCVVHSPVKKLQGTLNHE